MPPMFEQKLYRDSLLIVTSAALFGLLFAGVARAVEFETRNPLRAFVYAEYPLGDDYFINGIQDTHLLRYVLTKELEPFEGVAFSEISIWGNRTGPWEVFRRQPNGMFVYAGTKHYPSVPHLESCRTNEYVLLGTCTWQHGWPDAMKGVQAPSTR